MKLYDVVFTNNKETKLNFVETSASSNSKYKSIYIENDKTQQRYFLSKDVIRSIIKSRKDKSKLTYPNIMNLIRHEISVFDITTPGKNRNVEAICNTYEFNGLGKVEDIRNYNVVLDNETDDTKDSNILSIAIDTNAFQFVDYEFGGRVIQTGRRNGFQTCLIDIPNLDDSDDNMLIYAIGIILRPVNEYGTLFRYNVIISKEGLLVYKFNLEYSEPTRYIEYVDTLNSNPNFFKSFKLSDVCGICTEVVLVNPKYVKNVNGDVSVPILQDNNVRGNENIKMIVPCTEDMVNSEEIDESLNEAILSKNIRAITTVGIKLNKEFYKRYKILYMYSYNPKTGISTCVKTN